MLGAVDEVLPSRASCRLGDKLVLQLVEIFDAFARFVAGLGVGLGDVDRAADIGLAPPRAPGRSPAVLIARDLRADIAPGGVPGAGEDRVAEPTDRRKSVRRAGGDADRRQLAPIGMRRARD